jgi:hypothetical protein
VIPAMISSGMSYWIFQVTRLWRSPNAAGEDAD